MKHQHEYLYLPYPKTTLFNWLDLIIIQFIYNYVFTIYHTYKFSLWRRANARNVRLYYPYWQYTYDTFLYFKIYLYSGYAAHYVYFNLKLNISWSAYFSFMEIDTIQRQLSGIFQILQVCIRRYKTTVITF